MDNGHADYDKTKKSLDKTKLSGETGKGFEFLVSFTHLMEKSNINKVDLLLGNRNSCYSMKGWYQSYLMNKMDDKMLLPFLDHNDQFYTSFTLLALLGGM